MLVTLDAPARVDLVTIGSPLGRGAFIGEHLSPPFDGDKGQWPASVRRWTDIVAVGDPVIGGHPVEARFPGVRSEQVDNGHRAHDPEPYLCARATGAAVMAALSAR